MQEPMIPARPFMLGEGAHYPLHFSAKPGAYQLPKETTTSESVIPEGNKTVQIKLLARHLE